MASKETSPSKGRTKPRKRGEKKDGARPEDFSSSPDKKSETANTSLTVQLPERGTRERRERSLSPASIDPTPPEGGKSPKECAMPQTEGAREHLLTPGSKDPSPSKSGKSSKVYVKKVEGTPVPRPTSAREHSLSPSSKETSPSTGKSPTEYAKPPTEGARERSMSPASKDTSPSKRGKSSTVYVKKVEGTPVPPPTSAREHSLSPSSKETSPSTGKSATVYVKKVEGTPVPPPTSARERLSPASKDLPPEKGGKSPTVYVDEATPGGATPHKHMQEISPVQDDKDDSTTGGCFPCSPLKRLTPRKTKGKTGASPDAASPDKNTVNTSFSMDENGSVSTGCFIPSPLKFIRSPKKPKKKSGATRFGTSPDKSTPETSPVPGDDSDTARCLSPTSEGKKTGGATLGPNAGVKPVQEHEVFVWHDFPNAQKEGGATPDAASSDKKPTGTAGAPPDAASPDKKPTGTAGAPPDAASPDKKPTGTSTVQDAESDTPQCLSPTSKERSACPHPAQTSRQPEFTTPQPPHPRAHRQTSAVSERSPAFGIDLSTDAAAADTDVPLVVSLCVAVVDNWCEQNKSCATSAYCQQGETKEMQAIVEAFNSGNITITTLNGFTAHSVANILKKYLRELPNPVIPEDMYDRFIEFIKTGRTTTSGRIVTTLVDLVNDMPAVHGSTLRHLLAHFSKILRWQDESGVQEKFEKLLNVFSHILMRPPWDRISELGENTKHHNDVLHRLILEGVWGVIMPALPQPTAHRPQAPDSNSSPERRLHDAPWYWAGISKDLARDVMMNQPERSFMVRDSTTEGDYTLLVKFQNSIKSIKIMRRDDHYGLVEPLQFPSVVTLINWYQCNSLATFNSILNTTLVVPVIRSVAPEHPSGTPAQEVEVLRIINKRYKKQHALYDYLYEWYSWVAADIELKSQARDTYEHLLNVLDAQIGGLHSTAGPRANQDNQRLVTARERVQDCKKNISDHIQCQQGKHRLINGELSITKQEVHQLHKQRELWIAWLRARNMTQELIDRLADLNDPVWFVNCERAEATAILQGKLDGTFLIRPSREENMHALSIMYKGEVTHCKILCVGDYYGFSEHSLSFTSLKDLVNYYHDRSLASHNEELDICLLYPVHLVHVQGPSGARQS
ncbi:hypothetical protein BsWGS_19704 [Bradybaena similaris]